MMKPPMIPSWFTTERCRSKHGTRAPGHLPNQLTTCASLEACLNHELQNDETRLIIASQLREAPVCRVHLQTAPFHSPNPPSSTSLITVRQPLFSRSSLDCDHFLLHEVMAEDSTQLVGHAQASFMNDFGKRGKHWCVKLFFFMDATCDISYSTSLGCNHL